ncbi:MAG: type I DNA topoisomerase [Minisyncoccia bacterium]
MNKLIIVESPTKAKTISKFIGDDYKILSSYGHIRDLPKSKLGIDIEHNFEPQYIIPTKARKIVSQLKNETKKAEKIILASDEDREGEAIAFHLSQILNHNNNKKIERIAFHEITPAAIQQALKNPRSINMNLVNAQQGRRILDRLVGYKLSPFLWKKIARGLSAGRVQSVALKLIVEREQEIKNFIAQTYYTIETTLQKETTQQFIAQLNKINNKPIEKPGLTNKEYVIAIKKELENAHYQIKNIDVKEIKKNALPPFTTSTLQQEAFKAFKYSSKQTMIIAQHLYELGYITYMRTDSVNIAPEALQAAQKWIKENLNQNYWTTPQTFKIKSKLAQEAHEAIRPTDVFLTPEIFKTKTSDTKEQKIYSLIWKRFIASQLPPAKFSNTHIEIEANYQNKNFYLLIANGSMMIFDGFTKIWPIKTENTILPKLEKNDQLQCIKVQENEHLTQPPSRYNDASLVKILEKYGIGRPSTYAPIISILQERNYIERDEQKKFIPTQTGVLVNEVLTTHFPEIININFTASMEEKLDKIALGQEQWQNVIKNFYETFNKILEQKYKEVVKENLMPLITTNEKCEKCGKPMVIKTSRFGQFLACSGFPECKNIKPLKTNNELKDTNGNSIPCPKCKTGFIVVKRTKKKKIFYGCSNYPQCDYASWKKPTIENISSDKNTN